MASTLQFVKGMSPLHAYLLLIPLTLASACATKSAPVTEAPECESEPTIAVNDPEPPGTVFNIPIASELVMVRVFVVSPGGAVDEAVPEPIRQTSVCNDGGCDLLFSPRLLGRNRSQMELAVGDGHTDRLFTLEARPFVSKNGVELEIKAQLLPAGESVGRALRFSFSGTLEPEKITHVGTFHASDRGGNLVGPQVFAVVERISSEVDS